MEGVVSNTEINEATLTIDNEIPSFDNIIEGIVNNDSNSSLLESNHIDVDPIETNPYNRVVNVVKKYFGEDRVDAEDISMSFISTPSLIIHFPEFIITNSLHQTHTIRDLYMKLSFIVYNDTYISLHNVEYIRTTFSEKEVASKYIHSHVPKSNFLYKNRVDFQAVCLQTGINSAHELLSNVREQLYYDDIEGPWLVACRNLDEIVRWESLEGGPYIRIRDIQSQSGEEQISILSDFGFVDDTNLTPFLLYILDKVSSHPSLQFDKVKTIKDEMVNLQVVPYLPDLELENLIFETLLELDNPELYQKVLVNKSGYSINLEGFKQLDIIRTPIQNFKFKGNNIEFIIYPAHQNRNELVKDLIKNLSINSYILNYIHLHTTLLFNINFQTNNGIYTLN